MIRGDSDEPLHIKLRLPGMHNVRNALAAIAVAGELQISDQALIAALEKFEGIDRRFQSLGEVRTRTGKVMLVDDYGHHPTEIAATLAAARPAGPDNALCWRFSRTVIRERAICWTTSRGAVEADVLVA